MPTDESYRLLVTRDVTDSSRLEQMRRDTGGLRNNEHIGLLFDTFYDRRSGFAFYTNPLGARADYSVVDEGGSNTDWNPVWTSKTGRFDGGWTVEMAIPFKSLRYRAGPDQVWGLAPVPAWVPVRESAQAQELALALALGRAEAEE